MKNFPLSEDAHLETLHFLTSPISQRWSLAQPCWHPPGLPPKSPSEPALGAALLHAKRPVSAGVRHAEHVHCPSPMHKHNPVPIGIHPDTHRESQWMGSVCPCHSNLLLSSGTSPSPLVMFPAEENSVCQQLRGFGAARALMPPGFHGGCTVYPEPRELGAEPVPRASAGTRQMLIASCSGEH